MKNIILASKATFSRILHEIKVLFGFFLTTEIFIFFICLIEYFLRIFTQVLMLTQICVFIFKFCFQGYVDFEIFAFGQLKIGEENQVTFIPLATCSDQNWIPRNEISPQLVFPERCGKKCCPQDPPCPPPSSPRTGHAAVFQLIHWASSMDI